MKRSNTIYDGQMKIGPMGLLLTLFDVFFYVTVGGLYLNFTLNDSNQYNRDQCVLLWNWGNLYARFAISSAILYLLIALPFELMVIGKPIIKVNEFDGGKKWLKVIRALLAVVLGIMELVLLIGITVVYDENEPWQFHKVRYKGKSGYLNEFAKIFLIVRWTIHGLKIAGIYLYTYIVVGITVSKEAKIIKLLKIEEEKERLKMFIQSQNTGVQKIQISSIQKIQDNKVEVIEESEEIAQEPIPSSNVLKESMVRVNNPIPITKHNQLPKIQSTSVKETIIDK